MCGAGTALWWSGGGGAAPKRFPSLGTSGPRITARFFGGWSFDEGLCADAQMVEKGYAEGNDDGYNKGYEEGYDKGYDKGHAEGNALGHNDGYFEGYDEGNKEGYFQARKITMAKTRLRLMTRTMLNPAAPR